jgi:hypothetical protein
LGITGARKDTAGQEDHMSADLDKLFGDQSGQDGDPNPPVTGQGEGQSKLLAGKFKTPEDMEKAYKELETKLGTDSAERQSTRQELQALREEMQAQRTADTQRAAAQLTQKPGETDEAFFERLMDPKQSKSTIATLLQGEVARSLQPLQAMVGQVFWQGQWTDAVQKTKGEIEKYEPEIKKLFKDYPALASMPDAYLKAYKMLRVEGAEAGMAANIEEAKKQAQQELLDKLAGRTPGSGGAGRKETKDEWQKTDEMLFGKDDAEQWE